MPATADFFELQQRARRATLVFMGMFLAAMLAVAAAISVAAAMLYAGWVVFWGVPVERVVLDYSHLISTYFRVVAFGMPRHFYAWTAGMALAAMAIAALKRTWQLRAGGEAVAELMEGERIGHAGASAAETRLLDVVEEMAIASGIAVPPVYLLRGQRSINALAAGYGPNQAVIIATAGAIEQLTRDELQGVIGHEFSHILNGDMRLNVRLMGCLYGIVFVWQAGKQLLRRATAGAIGVAREKQTLGVPQLVAGLLLSLIGWIGVLCARMIRAAISREREFLADAASVQFTRNPYGIAGALDTVLRTRLGTVVWCPHGEEMSHMYFGPGSVNSMGHAFATHPPIEERIRRVYPLFRSANYRARRPTAGEPEPARAVAVLDEGGNVVQAVIAAVVAPAILAAAGQPTPEHVDHARGLLDSIPSAARERMKTAPGAVQLAMALVLDRRDARRAEQLGFVESKRGAEFAAGVAAAWQELAALPRGLRLPLASMELPVLNAMAAEERGRLVEELVAIAHIDHRVTLSEFILIVFLKQQLNEDSRRARPIRFRSIAQIEPDARRVLSLIAHASAADTGLAFNRGAALLQLKDQRPLPASELSFESLQESLERLRLLAPLVQPLIIKACFEAAAADGVFRLEEVELIRTFAAVLDCPLPPVLAAADTQTPS